MVIIRGVLGLKAESEEEMNQNGEGGGCKIWKVYKFWRIRGAAWLLVRREKD